LNQKNHSLFYLGQFDDPLCKGWKGNLEL